MLSFKFRVTLSKFVIRDVGIDFILVAVFHIGFVGVARVGGDDGFIIDVVVDAEFFIACFDFFEHWF